VVARQLGKVCLVACPNEGDLLALDGNTTAVHAGQLSVTTERPEAALSTIASWQIAKAA
jgi:hypothetical protein